MHCRRAVHGRTRRHERSRRSAGLRGWSRRRADADWPRCPWRPPRRCSTTGRWKSRRCQLVGSARQLLAQHGDLVLQKLVFVLAAGQGRLQLATVNIGIRWQRCCRRGRERRQRGRWNRNSRRRHEAHGSCSRRLLKERVRAADHHRNRRQQQAASGNGFSGGAKRNRHASAPRPKGCGIVGKTGRPGKAGMPPKNTPSCDAVLDEPGIGGSSRSCVHEKHRVVRFFLGKRSLLVLRMASCHAAKR